MHPGPDTLTHHYKDTIFSHSYFYNMRNSDLSLKYHYVQLLNTNHIKYFPVINNNLTNPNLLLDTQLYSLFFHKYFHIGISLNVRLKSSAISIFKWISYNLYLINIVGTST